ncbi:MAG: TadE/TadG family type IV pilus assembly protein, partial [Chloroflexota bacterium]
MAEFAITLPILLLLLFGIIEFGRIFQAWVTLQNSARAAARYATTGVYNTDKYKLDLNVYDSSDTTWPGDLDSIVPCLKNEEIQDNPTGDPVIDGDNALAKTHNLAQRGVSVTYNTTTSGFNTLDPVQAFQDGPESIYATYYSGDDCDPTDPDDQNRRKDLARILSV